MIEAPEPPHLHKPTEPDAAPPRHAAHRWFEYLTSIVLVVISACSLYVAYHTSHTMESLVNENARLVRAQSTPLLDYASSNADDGPNALAAIMTNGGTGPARIVWSRFTIAGTTHPTFESALEAVIPGLFARGNFRTSALDGTILRANEARRFFQWNLRDTPEAEEDFAKAEDLRAGISAEICYCSFFDECWRTVFIGAAPTPVATCGPAPAISVNSR